MTDFTIFAEPDESAWRMLRVQTAHSVYTVALHQGATRRITVLRGTSSSSSREIEVHDTEARLDDGRSLFDTNPWVDWLGHSLHVGSMRTSTVENVSTEVNAALGANLTSTYLPLVGAPENQPGGVPPNRTVLRNQDQPDQPQDAPAGTTVPQRDRVPVPDRPAKMPPPLPVEWGTATVSPPVPKLQMKERAALRSLSGSTKAAPPPVPKKSTVAPATVLTDVDEEKKRTSSKSEVVRKGGKKGRKTSRGRRLSPRQLVDLMERAKRELRRLDEDPKVLERLCKNAELSRRYAIALTWFGPLIERSIDKHERARSEEDAQDE